MKGYTGFSDSYFEMINDVLDQYVTIKYRMHNKLYCHFHCWLLHLGYRHFRFQESG